MASPLAKSRDHDPRGIPEKSDTALLLIDVINDFDFPKGDQLLRFAIPAARRIAGLKEVLRRQKIPAIYVNDNFGRWQSDFQNLYRKCASSDCVGAPVAKILEPSPNDYFVLKPKHSGFYSTSLEVLLGFLGATRLILSGFAADICVLFTVNDAYMRGFEIFVPGDCIASETAKAKTAALAQMKRFSMADTRNSVRLVEFLARKKLTGVRS